MGKTTVAKQLKERIAELGRPAHHLELDALRRPYLDVIPDRVAAMGEANRLAMALAKDWLPKGVVIVDCFKDKSDYIDPWLSMAKELTVPGLGVKAHEFYLTAPKEVVLERVATRGVSGWLTPERVGGYWDNVEALYAAERPEAVRINTEELMPPQIASFMLKHMLQA